VNTKDRQQRCLSGQGEHDTGPESSASRMDTNAKTKTSILRLQTD